MSKMRNLLPKLIRPLVLSGLLLPVSGPVFADGADSCRSAQTLASARPDGIRSRASEPVFTVQLHGTVRAKFEYQPDLGQSRFQVRNARFSVSGSVTRVVDYKAEIDLSDEGAIKMLDAYGRLNLLDRRLRVTIGQMRVPFTIDAHRSPHQQYFANRSFIAKQAGNVRDVGATLGWTFGREVPVTLEGGLFNGSGLTDQKDFWTRSFNYSAKAQIKFADRVNLALSIQKTHPDIVDIHMYDVGAYYENPLWHIEAEYLRKNYAKDAFEGVNVVDAFICRNLPLRNCRGLRQISILARYDYMSDHSTGIADPTTGRLVLDDPERHRVTGGVTLSLGLPFRADLRLNYEAYFYRRTATPALSEQDKVVAEFMIRF
ncbi:porin [uncultured Alistipes sp.]|uniref:porin n=1 Tax=uncultured Alistipes sp. TaxID=538949 RepID=UPI0032087585